MKKVAIILLLLPRLLTAQIITTIAGNGISGYSGDGGPAAVAEFYRPYHLKFDHAGNMYIADNYNNVIRKINAAGIISTIVGNGYGAGTISIGGYSGDNGPATSAELNGPIDMAFDLVGNLYFSDNGNAVIRKVNISGIITTIAGTGSNGDGGDGGPATNALLNDPGGLVFDNIGNLYFSDAGNARVRKISASGIISTVAGTGAVGYSGDGGPATAAKLSVPQFLAISPLGELYIPDWENHRIRKVNSLGIISTIAGNGIALNNGDGGLATAAAVRAPDAIVFDDFGNFYISSVNGGVIRKVNASGIITTVVGTGVLGYGGDGGAATAAQINVEAICSAVDAGGNLYISDSKNNRIRRVLYNNIGVKNVEKSPSTVIIYPNPAYNKITISATDEIEVVEMINLMGQTITCSHNVRTSKEVQLNIEYLPVGVYFVRVNGVYSEKFVKE